MFRFTLLLCSSMLLYGCSASPFKSWGKEVDPAYQETKLSDEFDEKMALGLKEVEPVEELDLTDTDIDPKMLIWKAVKQLHLQRYDKPEQDKDQLYHLPEAKLAHGKKQHDTYALPQQYGQARLYQEPEKDMDDLYHAKPEKLDGYEKHKAEAAEAPKQAMYMSPEEDKDGLYHETFLSESIVAAPAMHVFDDKPKKVYTEPEVDLDKHHHS